MPTSWTKIKIILIVLPIIYTGSQSMFPFFFPYFLLHPRGKKILRTVNTWLLFYVDYTLNSKIHNSFEAWRIRCFPGQQTNLRLNRKKERKKLISECCHLSRYSWRFHSFFFGPNVIKWIILKPTEKLFLWDIEDCVFVYNSFFKNYFLKKITTFY